MVSRKGKYAIRALLFLAREYGRTPVTVERIASGEGIPRKFLEAIMLDLIFLAAGLAFFAAAIGYTLICEKL